MSLLLLVAMHLASSFLLLVVRPGAPSSVLQDFKGVAGSAQNGSFPSDKDQHGHVDRRQRHSMPLTLKKINIMSTVRVLIPSGGH